MNSINDSIQQVEVSDRLAFRFPEVMSLLGISYDTLHRRILGDEIYPLRDIRGFIARHEVLRYLRTLLLSPTLAAEPDCYLPFDRFAYKYSELIRMLGMSRYTLYRLIMANKLRIVCGVEGIIARDEIVRFLTERTMPHTQACAEARRNTAARLARGVLPHPALAK